MSDYPIKEFKNKQLWRAWLEENHSTVVGIWLKIYKKMSEVETVSYDQALDEALCYGWIDGQRKKYDQSSFLQKFTPRREKSIWSKKNINHIERLESLGKLMPSGKSEVQRAKKDGRWQASYESSTTMKLPEDFIEALKKNKKAQKFFWTLNKTNVYKIYLQLHTAKKVETK